MSLEVVISVAGEFIHAARVAAHSLATRGVPAPPSGSRIVISQIGDICEDCLTLLPASIGEWEVVVEDARSYAACFPSFEAILKRTRFHQRALDSFGPAPTADQTWMIDADLLFVANVSHLLDLEPWAAVANPSSAAYEFHCCNDPWPCISGGFKICSRGMTTFENLVEAANVLEQRFGLRRQISGDECVLNMAIELGLIPQPRMLSQRYNWYRMGQATHGEDSQVIEHVKIAHMHAGRWKTCLREATFSRNTWGAEYQRAAREAGVQPLAVERRRCGC